MKPAPKVSIIIPTRKISQHLSDSMSEILALNWKNFEIIVFTDKKETGHWPKTLIISQGKASPGKKRNLAIKYARGQILAFIDDDAYPKADWLKKALRHFKDKNVAAVGGPAVTPNNDSFFQKISGSFFESYLGAGAHRGRYLPLGNKKNVDDWPTVNLLVRKDIFEKVGGFDKNYWPGEDTKLCLDIINAGYKIVYEPKAIVYHHRKNNLLDHLKQVGGYGFQRGLFVKKYPETSFKLNYFLPLLFSLYLIFIIFAYIAPSRLLFSKLYFLPFVFYIFIMMSDIVIISLRWQNLFIGLLTGPLIILTHLAYGLNFLRGLLTYEQKI